jgi:butyrate kinase
MPRGGGAGAGREIAGSSNSGCPLYQVAKEIGANVLRAERGGVMEFLSQCGIAYSENFTRDLSERIKHLGPVFIYPGEDELRALAYNGLRVLEGKAKVQEYT